MAKPIGQKITKIGMNNNCPLSLRLLFRNFKVRSPVMMMKKILIHFCRNFP